MSSSTWVNRILIWRSLCVTLLSFDLGLFLSPALTLLIEPLILLPDLRFALLAITTASSTTDKSIPSPIKLLIQEGEE